ncbi:hypothetical protein NT6N_35570 [Oceaniferula spumae]|uniref:Lipoprotein n=1 Tax=Oceaniferula spumae TaxID=2979115 RepID=A0AAT9FRA4_9BACT
MKLGKRNLTKTSAVLYCLCFAPLCAEPTAEKKAQNEPSAARKPLVTVKHTSLYKNSHILSNRGEHCIVPKNSILFLPDKLKTRVVEKPSGKFVLWPFFKLRNQQWIWTYEVTLDQAKGIKPLPKGTLEQFSKLNRVVVALYRGHPVSVIPPKSKKVVSATTEAE